MNQKVLIVGKEPKMENLLLGACQNELDIRASTHSENLIQVYEEFSPDLVIFENVPVKDCLEFCQQVRLNSESHTTKVVIVSGQDQMEDKVKAYQGGIDEFLAKPIIPDEYLAKIKVLLRQCENEKRLKELMALNEKARDEMKETLSNLEQQVVTLNQNLQTKNEELIRSQQMIVSTSKMAAWVISQTRELQEKNEELARSQQMVVSSSKMAALGEMAGGVAHEINNPLASLKNILSQMQDVIEDEPLDKKLIQEMALTAEKTTSRIAKIVAGLRSFSRDGRNDPYQSVSVQQLIDETLSLCHERFRNNGTELIVQPFDKDITFEGRHTQISQVLLNLLNNSHDSISSLKEKWIKVSVNDSNDWLEILVTDSGDGIPLKIRDKIFQPFFTTKEIGKGTGLGLSISRGIIKSHGGELKIDFDCPNTCFVIRIPKRQSAVVGVEVGK